MVVAEPRPPVRGLQEGLKSTRKVDKHVTHEEEPGEGRGGRGREGGREGGREREREGDWRKEREKGRTLKWRPFHISPCSLLTW